MSALPFDQRDGFIWMNGNLVAWKEATLHVLSHGLHYASCVFEGERAYGGRIFKSAEHSERFRTSAELLDFEIPYSVAELDKAKQLVVDKNNLPNCYVRPIAWRGSETMAVAAQNSTVNVAIAVWDWPSMFRRIASHVKLCGGSLTSKSKIGMRQKVEARSRSQHPFTTRRIASVGDMGGIAER